MHLNLFQIPTTITLILARFKLFSYGIKKVWTLIFEQSHQDLYRKCVKNFRNFWNLKGPRILDFWLIFDVDAYGLVQIPKFKLFDDIDQLFFHRFNFCHGFRRTGTRYRQTVFCIVFLAVSSISENYGFFPEVVDDVIAISGSCKSQIFNLYKISAVIPQTTVKRLLT